MLSSETGNSGRGKTVAKNLARAAAGAAIAVMAFGATASLAEDGKYVRAGTLTCQGEGGWGAIITSKKEFDCTYASIDGSVRESYKGTIRKYGLDIGMTGKSALAWIVLSRETDMGDGYQPGDLAGKFSGVGVEATVGTGLGANVLVRVNDDSLTLQPVSVQLQTGLSVAAGVQTLELEFLGVMQ